MYLSFKGNHMAELRISVDETYKLMLTEDLVETFNYVDFIEDILSIKLNEYRNILIHHLAGNLNLPLEVTHYQDLEYELRSKGIFPGKWCCKTTSLILYLMNSDLPSINRFYNTLLLLKRNDFFAKQYKSYESAPFLASTADVFGKTEVQNNGATRVSRIFSTSLEMMFCDLISVLRTTKCALDVDIASKLLRQLVYQDVCYELLQDALDMDYTTFCEKHLSNEYCAVGTLQTIFNCLSVPAINNAIKDEVQFAETTSWYGNDNDYITSGDIRAIPIHIFSNEYVRDRFACQSYLTGLYEKYRIDGMYHITPNGTEGWIGLIVSKVLTDGYKFKKCIYCNSYSVMRSQNICNECQRHYKDQIDEFNKKDGARRKNKRDMSVSGHDKPIVDFYISLYDKLHDLLITNFTNMLKEESFDKQKPVTLDYDLLDIDQCYIDDFLAQDKAEREILAFEPHSEYRYNLIHELWAAYMIPKRFVKSIFGKTGRGSIDNIACDFLKIVNIKDLDKYGELIEFLE